MKKLLVLVLTVIMVLAIGALAYAEATLSGEIDTGYKTTTVDKDWGGNGKTTSTDYAFGNMKLSGKLGDDLTGVLVFKADPANTTTFAVDEADVTFTEGFGTAKFGYFGWNNNLKDIVDSYRCDVKSQFVSSAAFKVADNFTIGVAYALIASDAEGKNDKAQSNRYGVDLGYATDTFGVDAIFTNSGANTVTLPSGAVLPANPQDAYGTTGIQGWYKMDAFKFFVQYITEDDKVSEDWQATKKVSPVNEIIGFTYDTDSFYGRFEYDLSKQKEIYQNGKDLSVNQYGVRVGYKLADGAKIEYQNFLNNFNTVQTYLKLICVF